MQEMRCPHCKKEIEITYGYTWDTKRTWHEKCYNKYITLNKGNEN